jgi:hypothetical protein
MLAKRTSCSLPFQSPYFLSFSSSAASLDRPNHRFFSYDWISVLRGAGRTQTGTHGRRCSWDSLPMSRSESPESPAPLPEMFVAARDSSIFFRVLLVVCAPQQSVGVGAVIPTGTFKQRWWSCRFNLLARLILGSVLLLQAWFTCVSRMPIHGEPNPMCGCCSRRLNSHVYLEF